VANLYEPKPRDGAPRWRGWRRPMDNAQRINQDSGDTEYYTPQPIIEAARRTLGEIDLDPASSSAANARVRALRFFAAQDDGLKQKWAGRVWMNHPFSRIGNALWIAKLIGAYKCGDVVAACCITFSATSEKWFQPLMLYPQCFLSPRTNYFIADGSKKVGVTKGSVVTYLGADLDGFACQFQSMGVVKVPLSRIAR
jgi:hypothetical protein